MIGIKHPTLREIFVSYESDKFRAKLNQFFWLCKENLQFGEEGNNLTLKIGIICVKTTQAHLSYMKVRVIGCVNYKSI